MSLSRETTPPEMVSPLFVEMSTLDGDEWKETARWVRYEETVEAGGKRWSKPHVATISLRAMDELKKAVRDGAFMKELPGTDAETILSGAIQRLVQEGTVLRQQSDDLQRTLLLKQNHHYENGVPSFSDLRRSISFGRQVEEPPDTRLPGTLGSIPSELNHSGYPIKRKNSQFIKKLPAQCEAANVLVGEVDYLHHQVCCIIRLEHAMVMGDLTEVPVPTRFIFLLLGPKGHLQNYREIGRSIATLLSDDIFREIAYKAQNIEDILKGVDTFLCQTTVLPPGQWDPTIRLEPPTKLPSLEQRRQFLKEVLVEAAAQQKALDNDEEEDDDHGNDPALQRTGKWFGGVVLDIKRKAPHYVSDFTDALNTQCISSIGFMFFGILAPIVTFGGLLGEATQQRMAALENIFGASLCGVLYHLFSGQPLTIIGSTGPVLVFESILFDASDWLKIDYLSFRLWVNLWTAFGIFLMAIMDASSLVSYITRFTEESFATLIAVIFIVEAIKKTANIYNQLDVINYSPDLEKEGFCFCAPPVGQSTVLLEHARHFIESTGTSLNDTFIDYPAASLSDCRAIGGTFVGSTCYPLYDKLLMSILLTVGTLFLATFLKKMRNSRFFPSSVRQFFSDFAVMIAIVLMTLFDMFVGVNTPKLHVPSTFRPTWEGRGWVIPLFGENEWWTAPIAVIPAAFACILIFLDQQITAVIVNRKENRLKKGCGYHLDLLVLSGTILLCGFFGLPTYVAATVLSMNHVNSLRQESDCKAPGEVAQFIGVREQRVTGIVTFMLIGLSVLATNVLCQIPMPVLYGVFLFMGISALSGIQMFERALLLFMPMKTQPDSMYIRHVPIKKIHLFTLNQMLCFMGLWGIKSIKATSVFFPLMLIFMIVFRKLMEKFFSPTELKYLDDAMPDFNLRKKEDAHKQKSEDHVFKGVSPIQETRFSTIQETSSSEEHSLFSTDSVPLEVPEGSDDDDMMMMKDIPSTSQKLL